MILLYNFLLIFINLSIIGYKLVEDFSMEK